MTQYLLKSALVASVLLAPLGVDYGSAHAQSCSSKASQVAAQRGAKVLSASSSGNKCRIKLLVRSPNKPPKRVTVVVSK